MKKYKLKKDLPLAKAGTEVFINKNINMIYKYGDNECVIPIAHIIISEKDQWLEEVVEKPKSVWDLKVGDIYYTFDLYSSVTKYRWEEDGQDIGKRIYGFCFRSEEEAEKELKKRKAIAKIKKYCWENNINNVYNDNSVVFYINENNDVRYWNYFRTGNPIGYFSIENAQKILDNFKEELKIILE